MIALRMNKKVEKLEKKFQKTLAKWK